MLRNALLVFAGGGLGAVLRELLMLSVANLPGGFPLSIFVANMVAALMIGVFASLSAKGGPLGVSGKLLLTTGVLGGLSTFSSLVWGTDQLLASPNERATGIVYIVLSMVLGFALVLAGMWIGRRFVPAPANVR